MQEEPEDIDIKTYAKGLAGLVTLVFWAFCILIGYYIIAKNEAAATTWLLILGFILPVVVWAVVALIQEKHSGKETDIKQIQIPLQWGVVFLLVFGFIMFISFVIIPIVKQQLL